MNQYKTNYFLTVRPEVVAQICQFLDISSYLKLRLLNSDMDFIVKLINTLKMEQIKFCLRNLQEKNQQSQECKKLIEQDKIKLREYWKGIFDKTYFFEIKTLSTPPPMLIEIIKYFIFLINPIEKLRQDNYAIWKEFKQLITKIDNLIKRIFEFEPEKLSKIKLSLLSQILELNCQNTLHYLHGAEFIYLYILSIIEVRRNDYYNFYYDYQNKLLEYEKMIKQLEKFEEKYQFEKQ
ncbi:unnamed protein product [Paramecium octaurelia]|uniref:Uncharacterized protein n=1 Tax=Paramecium octaurelia TaxID=43137 RepID=A0A8S1VFH2_PAROT|nr:unnamed protein product [Paramecium octaurelia]